MSETTRPESDFEGILRLLRARTGLVFEPDRIDRVETGIGRAMAKIGITDPAQYLSLLDTGAISLDDLIAELTVGETYFFREPAQFEFIRWEVLSDILRRRGTSHVIRAWSTGCSSGEEAYSLAIVFAQEHLTDQSHVLATDISRVALAKARSAAYGEWSLRGDGAAHARPYLRRAGNRFVVDERIRRHVTFEYLNLALDAYPSFVNDTWGLDLILCRNVFIYFDRDTIRRVARRFFDTLAPGGWLLTGASDPPLTGDASFETIVTDAGVVYRRAIQALPVSALVTTPSASGNHRGVRQFGRDEGKLAGQNKRGDAPRIPHGRKELSRGAAEPSASVLALPSPSAPADIVAPECKSTTTPIPVRPASSLQKGDLAVATVAEAGRALTVGDYARVDQLTRESTADRDASALRVRALANLDAIGAEQACAEATRVHPFSPELHYLRAMLLVQLGRDDEAVQAVRRVIYLDHSLAVAHFTLGGLLRRRCDLKRAVRAYRNALDLCAAVPAEMEVPLSDGERAGRLAEAAKIQIELLDKGADRPREAPARRQSVRVKRSELRKNSSLLEASV